MAARGVEVDHSNCYRWVQTFTPHREAAFRTGKKRPVETSWRMDEPSIPRKGQWNYRYRAVDKAGQTLDFLLTAPRDKKAALRFLKQAVRQHGMPVKSTIDKRGAHTAAIAALKEATSQESEIRPINYLNTLVEQDPRAGKRIRRPRLGFKAFDSAGRTLCGIELRHLIKQGQRLAG